VMVAGIQEISAIGEHLRCEDNGGTRVTTIVTRDFCWMYKTGNGITGMPRCGALVSMYPLTAVY